MCGIAGIVGASATGRPVVDAMLLAQVHRGPDGNGLWCAHLPGGRNLVLGHRRLSIIDLSERGAQPMADVSGRFAITFNGELYNYVEIRNELKTLGAAFKSDSDTEVLLEAYKTWGEKCLERFNGMFAFALYDAAAQKLFCARDRYGEKPFLFSSKPGWFAFASEYKALLQSDEISTDYDEFRLLRGLHNASMGLDGDRQTVFNDIQQLLPSEAMTVDVLTLKTHIWRYWDVAPRDDYGRLSEADAFDLFRDLLTDSVRLRMRSDVPVGSCLSGGLDSSAIVCLIRKYIHQDGEYHTFTGRFPGTRADEWQYAKEVVAETKVIPHVVEPTPERFASELQEFMYYNELPVGSSSQYAQWCVFRSAKEHGVTVLLDGQGSDELLGGYEQYFQHYLSALSEAGDTGRLKAEKAEIRKRYPLALIPPARIWRDRLPLRLRHALAGYSGSGTSFLFGVNLDFANELAKVNASCRDTRFNALAGVLYQDSFGKFLTTLLRYGDRNSMAHSREVRLPFCDHRLAELVLSLPPHYLMGEVQTKRMLRESMRGILPENIRTRWNKQGFRPPQETWFQGALLKMAEEIINDSGFKQSGVWNVRWWRSALTRVKAGHPNLGWVLWHPLMMESWKRDFVAKVKIHSESAIGDIKRNNRYIACASFS
jgi:asparagine synthase (glutamine-hydrolysing)